MPTPGEKLFGSGRGLLIRRAHPSDLGSISQIENEAHFLPWSAQGIASELSPGGTSLFWVACPGSDRAGITGYICFRVLASELYLLNLAVRSGFRGRGIGKGLLFQCLSFGVRRGIRTAVLDVHRENHRAIRFYQRCGFRFSDSRRENNKIFSVMEMHFPESCLDFNIE